MTTSKDEEAELGKDYDRVLFNLEGKMELANDIKVVYKDLQNKGYIEVEDDDEGDKKDHGDRI